VCAWLADKGPASRPPFALASERWNSPERRSRILKLRSEIVYDSARTTRSSACMARSGSSPLKRDARRHSRFFDCRVPCPRYTFATFGSFARRSHRLARLVSRESHHLATRPTFGLCTRKVGRASNLSREKAWEIDRCRAMQTAFALTLTSLMSNTPQNEKNEQEAHDR